MLAINRPTLVTRCVPHPGMSDHDSSVLADIQCHARNEKPAIRKIYVWKRADITKLQSFVQQEVDQFTTSNSIDTPVDTLWSKLKHIIDNAADKFVPSKNSSSRYTQPWVTRHCKKICRQKHRAYNKAKISNSPRDWGRFKDLVKKSKQACRTAYNNFVRESVSPELKQNPKRFYSFIKSKKCDNVGVSALEDNGRTCIDDLEKANILNSQFSSVFSKEDDISPNIGSSPYKTIPPVNINVNGVLKLLQNLKPFKASGPDGIQSKFLNKSAVQIASGLTLVFQASIKQSKLPEDWRHTLITPIYKPGKKDRGKAENYRPVSLTSVACKVLEYIIYTNIMQHLDDEKVLSDTQYGFRKNRSCEAQLVLTVNDFAKSLNQSKQLDTILLDFSKAFDKVDHRKLLIKLDHYGVRGQMNRWVKSFLENRTQRVLVRGKQSSQAPVKSGVPQGTVLGPLLFLIYINDMPERVSSNIRLFADDSYLYREINSPLDSIHLQNDLDELVKWEKMWSMEFHPDKCKVLRITNKTKPLLCQYSMHGTILQSVDTAKYLGVTIHKKLSWKHHIDSITKKANATRAFPQRNLRGCPQDVKASCYKTYVRPIVEYASVVWDPVGFGNKLSREQLEMVQRRAARFVHSD